MASYIRAQCILPMDDGLPSDSITNTWYFVSSLVGNRTQAALDVNARLVNFYQAIDGVVFPAGVNSPMHVKYYDMQDPEPRTPFSETDIIITPSVDSGLPSEVAICLSFQGSKVSGKPQARRRGRLYIGPCTAGQVSFVNGQSRPAAGAITAITTAANTLRLDAITAQCPWAVYSPTNEAEVGFVEAFTPVTNGWVDNAFDTHRSRGPVATSRTLFP